MRSARERRPSPPFTTSTLQQEASRKLGFTTKRTMQVAQKLYEGVAIGEEGTVGLISYMRTDSVNLSGEALSELRDVIARDFGTRALPDKPNAYVTKSKNAQEAHEAVRPTSALRTPAQVSRFLSDDERRLYELIWKRAVASQMVPATLNTVSVDLAAGSEHSFRASGTTVVDPGFLAVYEEGKDTKVEGDEDEGRKLPAMKTGDRVPLDRIHTDQHFTQPPPRFTEAALVKALEEYGIGRPSTYASIIQTLLFRKYVEMESRSFRPSDVGRAVSNFLSSHFTRYVDYDFTARLEDELDAVSRGEEEWVPLMEKFWGPFKELVDDKTESVDRSEATGARELGVDVKRLSDATVRYLSAQEFPGNVRQLENLCHWLTVMAPSLVIEVKDLPSEIRSDPPAASADGWVSMLEKEVEALLNRGQLAIMSELTRSFEKALIAKALAHTGGRRIEASQLLGLGRNTLTRKIQELGLDHSKERDPA